MCLPMREVSHIGNFSDMIDSTSGDFTRTALFVRNCTLPHLWLTELRKKMCAEMYLAQMTI